ncbi:MAG: hypothetical protein ACM3XM_01895 [Mycobacterium leprae]
MFIQIEQNQGIEFAKARHEAMLAEALQRHKLRRELKAHRVEVAARLRFFRLYHLRRFMFRYVPRLAGRLAL